MRCLKFAKRFTRAGDSPTLKDETSLPAPSLCHPPGGISEGGSRAPVLSHHLAGTQHSDKGWDDPVPSLQPHLRHGTGTCVSVLRQHGALPSSVVRPPRGLV